MSAQLERVVGQAIAAGLLPAGTVVDDGSERPWPVVLLIALGAWLAAIPILSVIGLLLGDWVSDGVGTYVVGVLALAGAVVVLRGRGVPIFIEQLAVPALLIGCGCLAFALFRDTHERVALALLAALAVALVVLLPRSWLRVLLGAAAAALSIALLTPDPEGSDTLASLWLGVQGVMLAWIGMLLTQRQVAPSAAAAIEAAAAGAVAVLLAAHAVLAGPTMLVGAAFGGGLVGMIGMAALQHAAGWFSQIAPWLSLLTGAAGAAWLLHGWPGLRRPTAIAALALLVLLGGFLPTLGATLLILAICLRSRRYVQAAAAAVAVGWIIGSFYYQLGWPLATKAWVLASIGALFGLLGALMRPGDLRRTAHVSGVHGRRTLALWLLAPLATLAIANAAIWQKEHLIAHGDRLYMPLTPVDPRSLMQGDYMALNFGLPFDLSRNAGSLHGDRRPQVVVRRDARGVGQVIRLHRPGEALAVDEWRVQLTAKNGRWTFVTDGWFFAEGEGERFAAARFGEFRVDRNGRALLVGMADAELQPIR